MTGPETTPEEIQKFDFSRMQTIQIWLIELQWTGLWQYHPYTYYNMAVSRPESAKLHFMSWADLSSSIRGQNKGLRKKDSRILDKHK